ncbi:MAG: DUF456 domain-containing protein [Cyclobacteriaceae bacterium]|nr:DUF456 domain-containing protein [Cyclobacteriaceae bacterium]
MEVLWIVISSLLMLAGLVGCILPLIPGPPLSYAALLLLQLTSTAIFSTRFLVIWAIVVVVVTALDYVVPLYGTKRFGGTRYGIWGCAIGLIVGLWFGPIGIILGPFFGAFIGEWMGHRNGDQALRAALGSFFGFLFGTLVKLVVSVTLLYYFVEALI